MAHSPRLAGPAHASTPDSAPSPSPGRSRSVAALVLLTALVGLLVSLPGQATSQVASSQGAVTRASLTQDPSTQFASTQSAPAPDGPLPPDEAARTMVVPDGFQVTLFAGEPDVKQPIAMALDDRGRLWVAEAYNYPVHGQRPGDRIIILEDTDGDGRHDKRKVFYDKLNYVTGVEVGFGGVWVMSPPQFYFIPDRDGDDRPDGEPVVLLDGFGNHANSHNLANNFAWGPDGWLYGTHGRTNWSMIGKPGTPEDRRARFDGGVYRYHPVRHVWEPFADGMTNAWGLDWNDYGEAFVCNCVNPHLFHIIPGAHYEPWRNRKSSEYAYERIASIADHLHFVGRKTVQEGLGTPEEDEAGGGHAHCGTMVYLGDNWPAKYRNSIFMHNIHGKRINNDRPRRSGSGYVATHGPDLMRSRDSWFMGVSLIYGPDGGVYSADWSDTGECHSVKNTRRETGRVYKITYGPSKAEPVDISRKSNDELVQLHLHRNDWHVRHARRVLQERAAAGQDLGSTIAALRAIYNDNPDVTRKLRALWTLHALNAAADEFLVAQLDQSDEHLRSWAIRLLCDDGQPPAAALAKFQQLAARGDSAFDRLHLASGMQRLSPADRWPIVEALARRGEDERDQNLPLMNWYAIEPLVADDLPRFIRLAGSSQLSTVRKFAARRAVELVEPRRALELLVAELGRAPSVTADPKASAPKTGDAETRDAKKDAAKTGDVKTAEPDAVRRDLLAGMHEGLKGRRRLTMPTGWSESYASLRASGSAEVREAALRLALIFDDPKALAAVLSEAGDRSLGADVRNRAIAALAAHKAEGAAALFLNLLDDPTVRRAALQGLAEFDAPQTAETILKKYGSFDVETRQDAIQTLTSRTKWAVALLDALDANQLPRGDISAFSARQLLNLRDPRIAARVQKSWGDLRSTPAEKAKLIARYQRQLTREQLAAADRSAGRAVFKTTCANCHRLFDAGEKIGPDITGAQRFNLTYLLENIIDPSAAVARDFQMQIVETDGGRTITGLVVAESDVSITIQTATEQIVVPVAEIANRSTSKASMMPDGLLDKLTPEQVRDLIAYLSGPGQAAAEPAPKDSYDVVVYGGTAGGVAAAVQVRRMGKTVVLIEPSKHLGGLTSGGLGATDIGNKGAIGGISREFYRRVKQYYAEAKAWKFEKPEDYRSGRASEASKEDAMWTFEPSVAERILDDMAREAGVVVVKSERLDLKRGVEKQGVSVQSIRMESGRTFVGRRFIDATYEGDLLKLAGVSYHVGREANSVYDETLNGVQVRNAVKHQMVEGVDPYVKKGEPASGLLPGVVAGPLGEDGSGDDKVQAYNFRMCVTDVPENRVPFEKPEGYDELRYELLFRNFEAGETRTPWSLFLMPNRKTDVNNNFGFSTDNIGKNYDWPDGDYETRQRIFDEHLLYQRGLMWTLANHPRVPEKIRAEISRWGNCKDEFTEHGGWSHQIYVREARRMIGEYVMTQHNCQGRVVAEDSVGLAAYTMDSHNIQRYVDAKGHARNEGDVQVGGFPPYPIAYRSIIPKAAQCDNLLAPVALSASHIAYGSIRMEPVFMVLGQSAATAACQSLDAGLSVQKIDIPKLQQRLTEDGQVLKWTAPAPKGVDPKSLPGVVVDDADAKATGEWSTGVTVPGFIGRGYAHDGNELKGAKSLRFTIAVPKAVKKAEKYELRLAYSPHQNRATNVPVTVEHAGGATKIKVDQRQPPPIDRRFVSLGVFTIAADQPLVVVVSNEATDGYVTADAVQALPQP